MNLDQASLRKLLRGLVEDDYSDEEIRCIMEARFSDFSLRYQDHPFKLPYRRRTNQFKTCIHWGQRKLLLSCIQFMNQYNDLADLVVYAGAAPGSNVLLLAEMFPDHHFHLYDPRDFDSDLKKHPRIETFKEYFTDDTCKKYRKTKVLFWSDIRTGCVDDPDFEDQIQENNRMQERWHHIIKPEYAMYKFRLPYKKGHTEYMRGQIWMQVWAPGTSTETRLVVCKNPTTKVYSHSKYEKRMYYFNVITRQWGDYAAIYDKTPFLQKNPVPCLCRCFDCRAESEILKDYLVHSNPELNPDLKDLRISKAVTKFSLKISEALTYHGTLYKVPHGILSELPMVEKYSEIRKYRKTVIARHAKKIAYRDKKLNPNATKLVK